MSVLIILALVLIVLFFILRERRSANSPSTSPTRSSRVQPHPAYEISVGASKEELVRRLGQPAAGRTTGADILRDTKAVGSAGPISEGFLKTEYWLYQNTPPGHDTRLVISARGLIESLDVDPHPGNRYGRARHVVSPPNRQEPMAALWVSDRESVFVSTDTTARAIAEFAETFAVENVEHGLTDSQKSQRTDRGKLDELSSTRSAPSPWMRTPAAIREIGRELDHRGGFSLMQNTYYRARGFSSTPGRVSVVELLWDRIGTWER